MHHPLFNTYFVAKTFEEFELAYLIYMSYCTTEEVTLTRTKRFYDQYHIVFCDSRGFHGSRSQENMERYGFKKLTLERLKTY